MPQAPNTCSTCFFYRVEKTGEQELNYGYCMFRSPVVLLMPYAVPTAGRISKLNQAEPQATLQPASVRPLVRGGDFCADHAPRGA